MVLYYNRDDLVHNTKGHISVMVTVGFSVLVDTRLMSSNQPLILLVPAKHRIIHAALQSKHRSRLQSEGKIR